MTSFPEGQTHVIHASTSDRRLIVIYLHEVPRQCHAASAAATAHNKDGYFYQDNGNRLIPSDYNNGGSGGTNELLAKIVNELPLAGVAQHIELSDNAQFAFVTMTRYRTEVDSYNRAALMCKLLKERPGDPALLPYTDACARTGDAKVRRPNILDFVQVATLCMPGSLCPNFSGKASLLKIANGNYSKYGFEQGPCKPGSFCAQGVKQECPIGFMCPRPSMPYPEPCKNDQLHSRSCYKAGLTEEILCPKGTLCYTPYMPGLPAPPGYKTSDIPTPGPPDPGRPEQRSLVVRTR